MEQGKTTFDNQNDNNSGNTITEDIVSTYIGRVQEIKKQHNLGVEVENQTKIGDMITSGKRKEGELFRDYKMRRDAEQLIIKHYLKGVREVGEEI